MKICGAVVTWQDGSEALDRCVASIRDVVDELVIVDGLIDGVDPNGLPWFSVLEDLERHTPNVVVGTWRTQSSQRQVTLDFAREHGCDWLLSVDADEELMNPRALRPWLAVWGWDAFPLPFQVHPGYTVSAAFKLLHVPSFRRFACQGNIMENNAGELVQLIGQTQWTRAAEAGMPYIDHHPELRPPARRAIRLSELEVALEPYPDGVKAWLEPTYSPMLIDPEVRELVGSLEEAARNGTAIYYCPGCGRRYAGPGACEAAHERLSLIPLEVADASRA